MKRFCDIVFCCTDKRYRVLISFKAVYTRMCTLCKQRPRAIEARISERLPPQITNDLTDPVFLFPACYALLFSSICLFSFQDTSICLVTFRVT